MKPEIYIDGQPVYDIGKIELEPMDPIDTPPQVVKVASPAEAVLHASIQPGVWCHLVTESTKQAAAAFRALVVSAKRLSEIFEEKRRVCYPHWYYMSKHAKRARIRKKYRDRIERELFAEVRGPSK